MPSRYIRSTQERQFESDFCPKLEEYVDWIGDVLEPDQVFDDKKLQEWALANGFVEKE